VLAPFGTGQVLRQALHSVSVPAGVPLPQGYRARDSECPKTNCASLGLRCAYNADGGIALRGGG
jgi:hypothetical protein